MDNQLPGMNERYTPNLCTAENLDVSAELKWKEALKLSWRLLCTALKIATLRAQLTTPPSKSPHMTITLQVPSHWNWLSSLVPTAMRLLLTEWLGNPPKVMSNDVFCVPERSQALEFGQYDSGNGMQASIHFTEVPDNTAPSSLPINSHPTAQAIKMIICPTTMTRQYHDNTAPSVIHHLSTNLWMESKVDGVYYPEIQHHKPHLIFLVAESTRWRTLPQNSPDHIT